MSKFDDFAKSAASGDSVFGAWLTRVAPIGLEDLNRSCRNNFPRNNDQTMTFRSTW